jgi:hypothetical protein
MAASPVSSLVEFEENRRFDLVVRKHEFTFSTLKVHT